MQAWARGEKMLCDFEKISQIALAYRKKVFVSRVCVAQFKPFSEKIVIICFSCIRYRSGCKELSNLFKN
jgi:hypothetical protein